ncbi:hypothetical protein QUF72_00775 [Desulfobacterales bacterium HSG2]|nr:hypothetical protein [Desulfobacterales bacterium HSG2]
MSDAVSDTSPLLCPHRIGVFDWLPEMFGEMWIPGAVVNEFAERLKLCIFFLQRRGKGCWNGKKTLNSEESDF